MIRRPPVGILCLVLLAAAGTLAAQRPESRSEVELPLSVYDELRAAAKEKKGLGPEAVKEGVSYGACRVARAAVAVDLEARRATWEAVVDVTAGGPEPPEVALLEGPASIGRSAVEPGASARVDSSPSGTKLVVEEAGVWRVTLAGEIGGTGTNETDGIAFAVPRLACLPAAFDLGLPDKSTATVWGRPVLRRVVFGADSGAATLLVRQPSRNDTGPATVSGALTTIARLSGASVRTEVRLFFRVRKGLLESRTLLFPGASLVLVNGPVLASGPDARGAVSLRFEPAIPAGREVAVSLSFLSTRDEKETTFSPVLPRVASAPDELLEKSVTVVAEAGLLPESSDEGDWSTARPPSDAGLGADDVSLSWKSNVDDPKPMRVTLHRLQGLSVASALARVSVAAYVGETGDTRLLMTADVRTRSRASLGFRVPKDAVLLAAQVDGATALVSRTAPDRLEVPIAADSGSTRVTLLVGTHVAPPRDGEKLELVPPSPEEPVERATWTVVLPIGLAVKEPGRRLPAGPVAPPAPPLHAPASSEGDRSAAVFAKSVAASDRLASAEGGWSAEPALPAAPPAFVGDFSDLGSGLPPLKLTLEKQKQNKEEWF